MAATLQLRLTGGAGNGDPDASLGGVMSSTQVSATAINNVFDDVQPAEASAGDTEYRALDVYNAGDAQAEQVKIYIDPNSSSPAITFGDHGPADKLSLPNIPVGQACRVWFKRVVSAGAGNNTNDQIDDQGGICLMRCNTALISAG